MTTGAALTSQPMPARAGVLLVAVLCCLAVLASSWTLRTGSALVAQLLNWVIILFGLVAGSLALARLGPLSGARLISPLLLAALLLWYVGNVALQSDPRVFWQHIGNLLSGVLPGLVMGILVGISVGRAGVVQPASGKSAPVDWFERLVVLDALIVLTLAAYLGSNTIDNVLLVSVELLSGAENYQELGDALTINLLTMHAIVGIRYQDGHGGQGQPRLRLAALMLLAWATLLCGVLTGSNKLLLVAIVVTLLVSGHGFRLAWRRYPYLVGTTAFVSFVALLTLVIETIGFAEILAMTRLLDYGNVDSIFDIPSLTSRAEILFSCGALQFAYSPLLGALEVEHVTCGDGNYLHSLVSIQTHLGLLGTVLACTILIRGSWLVCTERSYRPLLTPLLLIVGVGFIAAYFTWLPYWYLFGLLAFLDPRPMGLNGRGRYRSTSPSMLKRTP